MGSWLLIALLGPAQAACPRLDARLDALEGAVTEARFDDARALLDVDDVLSCGAPVTADQLGRLWVAEGVLDTMLGDSASAADAFRAASAVASDPWRPLYGEDLRASFDAAVEEPAGGYGELDVDGGAGFQVHLDSAPAELPTGAHSGLHAVQLVREGEAVWGRVVYLAPEQRLVLEPDGLPEVEVAPAPEPEAVEPERKKSPALLIAGSAALALGAGAAVGALTQTPVMREAPDQASLNAAYNRQQVLGIAGYALLGAGAVGVGLHFAL